jgi:hypothetical protein
MLLQGSLAANARDAAQRNRATENFTGAQGFTAQSPQLEAQRRLNDVMNSIQDTNARRDIPIQAAQVNAGHLLETQRARESQYGTRRAEDIARAQIDAGVIGQLASILAGLV